MLKWNILLNQKDPPSTRCTKKRTKVTNIFTEKWKQNAI